MVVLSSATPRSAKYSHSSGTITPSDAVSALTVSRPSEGWQSIRMTSYSSIAGASTRCRVCSRPTSCTSCTSAADRSMLEGSRSMPGTPVGTTTSCERHVRLHQQVVDGQVHLVRVEPEPDRERALRVEVDQQHLAAELGQRRAEVDGGRGLADAALLVAHRDDPGVAVGGRAACGSGITGIGRPVGPIGADGGRHDRRLGLGLASLEGQGLGHGALSRARLDAEARGRAGHGVARFGEVGLGGAGGGVETSAARPAAASPALSIHVRTVLRIGARDHSSSSSTLGCAVLSPSNLICRHGDLVDDAPGL